MTEETRRIRDNLEIAGPDHILLRKEKLMGLDCSREDQQGLPGWRGEQSRHLKGSDSFEIEPASFVSFVGPSGSGKTTLLNLIGCLDKPTEGKLEVAGTDVLHLDRKQSASFRGNNLGFIFQDFNLIPVLTVFENIEYPLLMVQNVSRRREKKEDSDPFGGRWE